MRFVAEVVEVRGRCPVFKVGDRIVIEGPRVVMEETDAICVHALPVILHYMIAVREGVSTKKLGLSKEEGVAYLQCPDPGEPYTGGGTVIFKCYRVI